MKISLVGESYALRSPAAACQQSLNVFPQFIDDPNNRGKNVGTLCGIPGYHLMGDINALASKVGEVTVGVWSGGGRLFVLTDNIGAGTTTLWEIGRGSYVGGNPSTGAVTIVSNHLLTGVLPDGKPGQMFGNGNQLGIVKNGFFYIDNGSGPNQAQFLVSGTVNTVNSGSGGTVTLVSGDAFPSSMASAPFNYITIDGQNYTVTARGSSTSLTIAENPGAQNGAAYTSPNGDFVTAVTGAYLDGYFIVQRPIGQEQIGGVASAAGTFVDWVSGSFFDELSPGDTFTYGGTPYIVDTVTSNQITLTTSAGSGTAVWSANVGPDLGRQFNISAVEDGESWDPLDFAQKEGYSDHLVSILADHEQLFLMGEESMEIWQDTGNALFPFQRIPGAMTMEGSIATYGTAAGAEKVYYLGGSPRGTPVAYRIDGFNPVRISTHAEEAAWASNGDSPSDAIAYTEVHDGHQFWVICFTGTLNCWAYDETASQQAGSPMWHQRANWSGSAYTQYLLRYHTFVPEWGAAGIHVCGDYSSGKLFDASLSYFDNAGGTQQWNRILPALYAEGKRQFFGRLTLEMETTNLTAATQITRSYSDDRGVTFANGVNPILSGTASIDASQRRVFWPNNGSSLMRNFELAGNNGGNSRICLIDLDLEVEVGDF